MYLNGNWVGLTRLLGLPPHTHTHRWEAEPALPWLWWGVEPTILCWGHQGSLSQGWQEAESFLCMGCWVLTSPVRGENSVAQPSYLNTWFNAWFSWAPVVMRSTDINTDLSFRQDFGQIWPSAAAWTQMLPWPLDTHVLKQTIEEGYSSLS